MTVITEWIIPLCTLGSILVGIVMYITRKDTKSEVNEAVLESKFKMNEAVQAERFKSIDTKITLMMSNHLPHIDQKINQICEKVNEIDKTLFAHIENDKQ